jgi:hypothetical protein
MTAAMIWIRCNGKQVIGSMDTPRFELSGAMQICNDDQVKKNSVAPVEPMLWKVEVCAMSDCSSDMHRSSRRFWKKVLQHRLNRRYQKKVPSAFDVVALVS